MKIDKAVDHEILEIYEIPGKFCGGRGREFQQLVFEMLFVDL